MSCKALHINIHTYIADVSIVQIRRYDAREKHDDKLQVFRNPVRLFGQHAIRRGQSGFYVNDLRAARERQPVLPTYLSTYLRRGPAIKMNLRCTRKRDIGSNRSDRVA